MPGECTPEKRAAFLDALADSCNVSRACEAVGIARRTAYLWRETDPDFADEFDRARRIGAEALEDEAVRRAHEGTLEPVFYKGELVDTVRKYSDTLLIFLLKGAKPDVYKDRLASEVSGPGGAPLKMSDKEMEDELITILSSALARKGEADDTDASDLA